MKRKKSIAWWKFIQVFNVINIIKITSAIWSILGIVIMSILIAKGMISPFSFIILLIIYLLYIYSYFNSLTFKLRTNLGLFFILFDCFYILYITYNYTYRALGSLLDANNPTINILYTILWWTSIVVTLGFVILLIIFVIKERFSGNVSQYKVQWKQKQNHQKIKKRQHIIDIHEFSEKIVFIKVDNIYPEVYDNPYFASIIAKDLPLNKIEMCNFLFTIKNDQIIKIYKFKPSPAIVIDQENISQINQHLNINLTESSFNHLLLNVTKSDIPESINKYLNKIIDMPKNVDSFFSF